MRYFICILYVLVLFSCALVQGQNENVSDSNEGEILVSEPYEVLTQSEPLGTSTGEVDGSKGVDNPEGENASEEFSVINMIFDAFIHAAIFTFVLLIVNRIFPSCCKPYPKFVRALRIELFISVFLASIIYDLFIRYINPEASNVIAGIFFLNLIIVFYWCFGYFVNIRSFGYRFLSDYEKEWMKRNNIPDG